MDHSFLAYIPYSCFNRIKDVISWLLLFLYYKKTKDEGQNKALTGCTQDEGQNKALAGYMPLHSAFIHVLIYHSIKHSHFMFTYGS